MKTLRLILFLLCVVNLGFAQDITGKWYGNPQVGSTKLRIIFDIQKENDVYKGVMLSPDQTNQAFEMDKIVWKGDSLYIEVPSLNFVYKGVLSEENILRGAFFQNGMTFIMNLTQDVFVSNRPQEPKPPYPYTTEEVTFPNKKDKITLSGTFTAPSIAGKKYPAVILITGSGPQNRNEELFEHKPFLVLADHLTRNGIAVLRFDDRGVGKSEGTYVAASLLDHAEDAKAAVEYLNCRKEVDAQKVGAIGHSMGGTICFILAAEKQVSFIVSLAGMGIEGNELLSQQRETLLKASGAPDDFIIPYNAAMNKAQKLVLESDNQELFKTKLTELFLGTSLAGQENAITTQLFNPETKSIIAFDPQPYLEKITCPVLALNGEKDLQIPAESNLTAIKETISSNGNKTVRTKIYSGLNHLFQTAKTGLPVEYGQIEETINPEVLSDIVQWIVSAGE